MDDLISRQAAIEAIEKNAYRHTYLDQIISIIERMPTAEPERKTGRWILHENQRQEDVDNGNYLYICSECGKSDIHAKTQEVPFCWWCGSKMEVEHDG